MEISGDGISCTVTWPSAPKSFCCQSFCWELIGDTVDQLATKVQLLRAEVAFSDLGAGFSEDLAIVALVPTGERAPELHKYIACGRGQKSLARVRNGAQKLRGCCVAKLWRKNSKVESFRFRERRSAEGVEGWIFTCSILSLQSGHAPCTVAQQESPKTLSTLAQRWNN